MSELSKVNHTDLIVPQAQRVVDFLERIGLPSDNIIAEQSERAIIEQNLPAYIESLPAEIKRGARYLSKFVVGAGIGLFDYSLNAIWNEVVLDLRKKAIAYGIDIFFDSAVGGKARDFYKTEDDLASLKDAVLLDTCRKLELISDTTYKKLKHILESTEKTRLCKPKPVEESSSSASSFAIETKKKRKEKRQGLVDYVLLLSGLSFLLF